MRNSIALSITDASQVGDARRVAARFTADVDLPEKERGIVALVVTELGNNLAKYASDGQLIIRALADEDDTGVEIISVDSGPGFSDIEKRVEDGFSSGGTPGNGLGAVRRMSGFFDIYSVPRAGTAVLSRITPAGNQTNAAKNIEFGCISVPIHGEERCGDSWGVHQDHSRGLFMIVDGLGHGTIASEAADEAVRVFHESTNESPVDIIKRAHLALRTTRGAVMAVAEAHISDSSLTFAGVGNIAGCVVQEGRASHMISMAGTLGLAAKPKHFEYRWERGAVLVLNSDGLHNRWRLEQFPGLFSHHPSIIAGVLYQNYCRGRDDVSVLVARWSRG